MSNRLDSTGLSYLWNKIKSLFAKADLDARAYAGIQSDNMTALTSGQDLNDIKAFGVYYAQTNAIANSLVNKPVGTAFQMRVVDIIHQPSKYIVQDVMTYTGNHYRRLWNGSTWGAWTQWDTTSARNTAISNHNTSETAHADLLAQYAKAEDIPSLDGYAKTTDIPDISGKVNKTGDTMSGALNMTAGGINLNFKSAMIKAYDSTGFSYPLIRDNGSNMWLGATATKAQHHKGQVYISSGHNGTAGNETIFVSVPNAANDNATNYAVILNKVTTYTYAQFTYNTGFTYYATSGVNAPVATKWGRMVNLTGAYKSTAAASGTSRQSLGNVPAGCEPLYAQQIRVQGSGQNSFLLIIGTDGTLSAERYGVATNTAIPNNAWLNLAASYISKT